jgi:hypothetical protein
MTNHPQGPEPSASLFVVALAGMLMFFLSLGGAFLAYLLGAAPQ